MSKSLFERTRFKFGMLKMTNIELRQPDPEMYIFFEKGIKGWNFLCF